MVSLPRQRGVSRCICVVKAGPKGTKGGPPHPPPWPGGGGGLTACRPLPVRASVCVRRKGPWRSSQDHLSLRAEAGSTVDAKEQEQVAAAAGEDYDIIPGWTRLLDSFHGKQRHHHHQEKEGEGKEERTRQEEKDS